MSCLLICEQVWDVSSFACVGTCAFGAPKPVPEDMQVGIVWTGNTIISLSLRGELTYMDAANIASPTMVIRGHNKNITALAADASGSTLVSASYDGIMNKFTVGKPDAKVFPAAAACAFACCDALLLLQLCYGCGVAGSKCSKLKHSERCQLWGGYSQ